MRKVFKYKMLDKVALPRSHKIIMTAKQDGEWHVWVEFDTENESNAVEGSF